MTHKTDICYRPVSHACALDISDAAVKVAEIIVKSGKPKLGAVGMVSLPKDVVQYGEIRQPSVLAESIKKAVQEAVPKPISERHVMLSLPHAKMYIHPFEFPKKLSEQEVRSASQYEAEGVLPITLAGVYHDVQFHPSQDEHNRILFAAAPRELVDSYYNVLIKAGLIPTVIEAASLSIVRALVAQDEKEPVIVLDIGSWSSTVITVEQGMVHGSVSVAMGGFHLTEELAAALDIDKKEAEEMKRTKPLEKLRKKGREAVEQKLLFLAKEVNKSIRYHETHIGQQIKKIILTGGPALGKGVPEFISQHTALETEIGDSFRAIPEAELPERIASEKVAFSQVVGLGLRVISTDIVGEGINVIPPETKRKFQQWWMQRLLATSSAIIAFVAFVILALYTVWGVYIGMQYLQHRAAADHTGDKMVKEAEVVIETARGIEQHVQEIQKFYAQRVDIGTVISEIIAVKPADVQLSSLSYGDAKDVEWSSSITVSGVAATRETLVVFEENLRDSAPRIDSPSSNFDSPRDVRFTITLYYE